MLWNTSISGELSFKDAYNVIYHVKTFVIWKIIHNVLPIDDNLRKRGFSALL